MTDLIDRAAAIDAVRSYYDEEYDLKYSIEELIEKLPSADVAPVRHGRWIDTNGRKRYPFWVRYECSECGAKASDYRFCPHCGARMDGEQND